MSLRLDWMHDRLDRIEQRLDLIDAQVSFSSGARQTEPERRGGRAEERR